MRKSRTIELPYPPSVNHYWRHTRRGTYISKAGITYRDRICKLVDGKEPLRGHLRVTIWVYLPDRRTRDVDNILKALLDACTKGGVWIDDSQIRSLSIQIRGMERPYGRVVLRAKQVEGMLF